MRGVFALAVLATAVAAPLAAGSAEDDLQAVRKAVLASSASQARPPAEDPDGSSAKARPERAREGRADVVSRPHRREGRQARPGLRQPADRPRALDGRRLADPVDDGCRKRDRCGLTIGEVLRALDSGQSLVDIEDDETTVRVWVE